MGGQDLALRDELAFLRATFDKGDQEMEIELQVAIEHGDAIEAELVLANEQLRLENERIRLAKEQAENLARAKTEFVAVVSHEVRTPMNGLLGMTQLLLGTSLTHEQRDIANTVLSSGHLLLNILDELLDLSKIEAGKMGHSEARRLAQARGLRAIILCPLGTCPPPMKWGRS